MSENKSSSSSTGIGIGAVIAAVISFAINHSVFWAIIHAMCGWAYVIYWLGGCAGHIPD